MRLPERLAYSRTWSWISLLVFLISLASRVLWLSRAEAQLGDQAIKRGDPVQAISSYRRAARHYLPLNPYVDHALAQLARLGKQAERHDRQSEALSAFRSIRGSIMASRSFYVPHRKRLLEADRRIAHLMAAEPATPLRQHVSRADRERQYFQELRRHRGPSRWGSLAVTLTFWIWLYACIRFIRDAITPKGTLVAGAAQRWGLVVVLSFAGLSLSLWLA